MKSKVFYRCCISLLANMTFFWPAVAESQSADHLAPDESAVTAFDATESVAAPDNTEFSNPRHDDAGLPSEIEIFGIRLGMTGNEVLAILTERFPDLESIGYGRNIATMVAEPLQQGATVFKDRYERRVGPCVLVPSEMCIFAMDAVLSKAETTEFFRLKIGLMEDIPPRDGTTFVTAIQFEHHAEAFAFSPEDFVTEKYGKFVRQRAWESIAVQSTLPSMLKKSPAYRGRVTETLFKRKRSPAYRVYMIVHGWTMESRKQYQRDFEMHARRQSEESLPKSERPF